MRHIIVFLFFVLLTNFVNSQSLVVQKVDSVNYNRMDSIENRMNSFRIDNKASLVFYGIGVGFFALSYITQNQVQPSFTYLMYGIGTASTVTGFVFYLDSFKYLNPARKKLKFRQEITY